MLRAVSGSVILPQSGSVLMYMACIATKDHKNAQLPPVVMLRSKGHELPGSCQSEWSALPPVAMG